MGKIRSFLRLDFGEEAMAVGMMQPLTPDDAIVATYREHGLTLARGSPTNAMMAEMYGKPNGCSRSHSSSMHFFAASRRFYMGGYAGVRGGLSAPVRFSLADGALG